MGVGVGRGAVVWRRNCSKLEREKEHQSLPSVATASCVTYPWLHCWWGHLGGRGLEGGGGRGCLGGQGVWLGLLIGQERLIGSRRESVIVLRGGRVMAHHHRPHTHQPEMHVQCTYYIAHSFTVQVNLSMM